MNYLRRVFLAQALDHVFAVAWVALLVGLALSFSDRSLNETLVAAGPTLWLASAGLFLVSGVAYRTIALRYLGTTAGQLFTGLRIADRRGGPAFVRGMICESLQPALPLIWMADFALRTRGRPLGWSYAYAFESLPA